MRDRIGNVGDEGRRLGVDLAALEIEPAVDAVIPMTEPSVCDRDGPNSRVDARGERPAKEDLTVATNRLRLERIVVRLTPWPGFSRDRQLLLDRLVVRAEVLVRDRPIGPDAVE